MGQRNPVASVQEDRLTERVRPLLYIAKGAKGCLAKWRAHILQSRGPLHFLFERLAKPGVHNLILANLRLFIELGIHSQPTASHDRVDHGFRQALTPRVFQFFQSRSQNRGEYPGPNRSAAEEQGGGEGYSPNLNRGVIPWPSRVCFVSAKKWRGVGDKLGGERRARLFRKGGQLPYSGWVNTLPLAPRAHAPMGKNGGRLSIFIP